MATEQLGIEDKLWSTANALRGSLDSSDYKHVVLGLLFLKYLFDAVGSGSSGDLPTPGDVSWNDVRAASRASRPHDALDQLVARIERLNPGLKDAFPRFSSFEGLSGRALEQLTAALGDVDLADAQTSGRDVLSRTYEYFLTRFAAAEGRLGGEFYTPHSIVRLMVSLLEPFNGTIYDPACGTGGMFVQAKLSAEASGGSYSSVRVVGQESNPMTWRLARLNLALHGIPHDLGRTWGDTFSSDQHPDLRADYILTNPPFGKGTAWPRDSLLFDERWRFGIPPQNPANFAWLQHYVARLADRGVAITVMPNGTLTSRGAEGEIRTGMIRSDIVECVIALPGQLFYSTPISVCLWILNKDKGKRKGRRSRTGEVLFIDARVLGHMTSRVHRTLSDEDIGAIAGTYHSWQGRNGLRFRPEPGFSAAVAIDQIAEAEYSLNPSHYTAVDPELDPDELLMRATGEAGATSTALTELGPAVKAAAEVLDAASLGLRVRRALPGTWTAVRVSDAGTVTGGGTPSTRNPAFFGDDVPWITPRDLTDHRGRDISRGQRGLTFAGLSACGAKIVPAGSVLVSSRAPIGLVALAAVPLCTNQGIRAITLDESRHDPRFWYYLMRASSARLEAAGNGTTFRELRGSVLARMQFVVPPLDEQREIAGYLESLEAAAERARLTATGLEQVLETVASPVAVGLLAVS